MIIGIILSVICAILFLAYCMFSTSQRADRVGELLEQERLKDDHSKTISNT